MNASEFMLKRNFKLIHDNDSSIGFKKYYGKGTHYVTTVIFDKKEKTVQIFTKDREYHPLRKNLETTLPFTDYVAIAKMVLEIRENGKETTNSKNGNMETLS